MRPTSWPNAEPSSVQAPVRRAGCHQRAYLRWVLRYLPLDVLHSSFVCNAYARNQVEHEDEVKKSDKLPASEAQSAPSTPAPTTGRASTDSARSSRVASATAFASEATGAEWVEWGGDTAVATDASPAIASKRNEQLLSEVQRKLNVAVKGPS